MLKKYFTLVLFLVLISKLSSTESIKYSNLNLPDTTKPIITYIPFVNIPKANWPVTLNCTVTDSSGIDSVWVKWYKNTPTGINRRFKLNNTTGNNYSGIFNSINSEVNYLDSIFYRIFAQDNSPNHNRDSSVLYKAKIISIYPSCTGYDELPSNYPFSTYWMDARTHILITAAELNALGFYPNMPIFSVSFYVQSYSSQVMNGFCVAFQNTSLTALTGFVEPGWIIGYYGTYTVNGTGRQTINMQNYNFHWNGTSNLLIEICYNNSSYTSFTVVNSSYAPGKTWGYYTDNSSGCGLIGGSTQVNRPNVCFQTPDYIGNINETIPKDYSLSQNYPNPFNPITRINFDIPVQGFVSLKVFDILGREVKTLVSEVKAQGSYSVDFDASELPSGVYLYRISSEDYTEIRKMILMK